MKLNFRILHLVAVFALFASILAGCDDDKKEPVDTCPFNSGWPCSCDSICDDGSDCLFVGNIEGRGICAAPCQGSDAHCPTTEFDGTPACLFTSTPGAQANLCALLCELDEDCPDDQICWDIGAGDKACGQPPLSN